MTKDTGGPAFPGLHPSKECRYADEGMTMRDYFAAKAMQSLILAAVNGRDIDMLTVGAYQMADAMIKERSK